MPEPTQVEKTLDRLKTKPRPMPAKHTKILKNGSKSETEGYESF